MTLKKIAAAGLLLLASCTDAQMAQWSSLGTGGHIKCWSGTQVIYEGDATGKISTEQGSDGWFFKEKGTNRLIRISGACLITN